VSDVYVYYWFGSGSAQNESMSQVGSTDYYEKEITIPSDSTDMLHYNISAVDTASNWVETGQKDVTIYDDDGPVISDVTDEPDPQVSGGNVNISCDVDDNIALNEVWVNVSGPAGFTTVNTTMGVDATGRYYYNETYTVVGTYDYFIWANDTSSNSAMSTIEHFGIATDGAPSITDNSPDSANTTDDFIVNVSVSDVDGVSSVWVEYWFGSGSKTNIPMTNTAGNYWENDSISIPYDSDDDLFYNISAVDTYGFWGHLVNQQVVVSDNISPVISDDNTPVSAGTGNSFIFNATVTDNVDVSDVYVYYWFGSGSAQNESMSQVGSTDYYEKEITIPSDSTDMLHYNISAVDTASNWVETGQKDVTIYDDDGPVISDVTDEPDPQVSGGNVNISCDVDDNIALNEVWVNVSGPAGFTTVNTTMGVDATGRYYYNETYTVVGTYDYFIWANDTSSNSAMSTIEHFGIATDGAPSITDNSPDSANTTDDFIVNVSVSDVDGVSSVWVEYWFGSGSKTNIPMTNTAGNYWENDSISIPYDSDDDLFYNISAVDTYGFWGHLVNQQVVVSDNISPVISDVNDTPDPQVSGGNVNISCDVDDNIAVNGVQVNVSGPAGFTTVNTTMGVDATGRYYYNVTYTVVGTYTYFIWANDASDNSIISSNRQFLIE